MVIWLNYICFAFMGILLHCESVHKEKTSGESIKKVLVIPLQKCHSTCYCTVNRKTIAAYAARL